MIGNNRVICFTPTQEFFAKGCYGIEGQFTVPTVGPSDKNDFLTRLFERARTNIAEETKALAPQEEAYKKALAAGLDIVSSLSKPEDVPSILEGIAALEHALTSQTEIKAALKKKMAELKITYDKATKTYKYAE